MPIKEGKLAIHKHESKFLRLKRTQNEKNFLNINFYKSEEKV